MVETRVAEKDTSGETLLGARRPRRVGTPRRCSGTSDLSFPNDRTVVYPHGGGAGRGFPPPVILWVPLGR